MSTTIALVTPAKNEINNLPLLVKSIEEQSVRIALWVILDDASTDGTTLFLKEKIKKLKNVDKVLLFHLSEFPQEYQLGSKYSQLISHGFSRIAEYEKQQGLAYDFIGILDADCFPCTDYYKNLLHKFTLLDKLGIASGVTYYLRESGKVFDRMPLRWARGGLRIWRKRCFTEAGYMVGNSADAISSAKAWTTGWQSQAFMDSWADTREMGGRINAEYYGKAAYYLYMPFYYICMKCLLMFFRYGAKQAKTYYRGYHKAMGTGNRIKVNKKVINYFRLLLWRNVYENIVIRRNNKLLKNAKV